MEKLRVGVLYGGSSPEREVSLRSGKCVIDELKTKDQFEIIPFDTKDKKNLINLLNNPPDVAFIALHGQYGEDGTIQGLLELAHIPYTGSDVLSSSLCIDKITTKNIYLRYGIPTPQFLGFNIYNKPDILEIENQLGYPVVVKASLLGSTIGTLVAKNKNELESGIKSAFDLCDKVLVEKFISGTEITVGVIGGEEPFSLPVVEIVPKKGFFDYEAKYTPGATDEIVPARISEDLTKKAQELGVKVHKVLGCWGVSRTDMFIDSSDNIFVIETNTSPGLTKNSLLPKALKTNGIEFIDFIELQINLALKRAKKIMKNF